MSNRITLHNCLQRCIPWWRPYFFTWTSTRTLMEWTASHIPVKLRRMHSRFCLLSSTRNRVVWNSWARTLISKAILSGVVTEAPRAINDTGHLPFIATFIWTRLPGQCSWSSIPPIFILIIIWRTLGIWMVRASTPCFISMNLRAL